MKINTVLLDCQLSYERLDGGPRGLVNGAPTPLGILPMKIDSPLLDRSPSFDPGKWCRGHVDSARVSPPSFDGCHPGKGAVYKPVWGWDMCVDVWTCEDVGMRGVG